MSPKDGHEWLLIALPAVPALPAPKPQPEPVD